MNTDEIEQILKCDHYANKIFKRVCAFDQLEQNVTYPSAFVINSDPSNQPGEHWVALFFDKNQKAEYFDSYGFPPKVLGLQQYIDKHSQRFIYNKKMLQGLFSDVCGHYAIYYLLFRCRSYSMNEIVSHFTSNTLANDTAVRDFVQSL